MSALAAPALTGFATAFALILAIGAQNAFVLRQGLMRTQVGCICLFCAVSDAILITAGVAGFGAIVARYPFLPQIMLWAGAAFLVFYGASRIYAAWRGGAAISAQGKAQSLLKALSTCFALTWLNPHVYLDTLGLIGAVSTRFVQTDAKTAFTLGACCASFSFFFSLGYGARLLAPVMTTPRTWQVLDLLIGLLMWALAIGLLITGVDVPEATG